MAAFAVCRCNRRTSPRVCTRRHTKVPHHRLALILAGQRDGVAWASYANSPARSPAGPMVFRLTPRPLTAKEWGRASTSGGTRTAAPRLVGSRLARRVAASREDAPGRARVYNPGSLSAAHLHQKPLELMRLTCTPSRTRSTRYLGTRRRCRFRLPSPAVQASSSRVPPN